MVGKLSHRLVVLGDGGVGKTAMVIQLTLQHFVETYDPTIEDSYRKQLVIDGEICFVEILDTAGQEEYTALREQWIRESEGAVIVYSISSRESFVRVPIFHAQVLRVKDDAQFPLFIVGNKSDRVTEREVSTQEGFMLSKELGCEFAESSAKNCENVEESFYDVVRQIRKRRLETLPSKEFNDLKSPETTAPVIARSPRSRQKALETIRSAFGRSKIHIPADEAKTEAGRLRLTRRLIDAARGNQEREVRAYLAAGAHLDGQPGADGAAIHAASASGHVNIVNLLLRKGAAVNAEGPSGVSPLQLAAAEGHSSIVRLLLHKGARIEQSSTLHGTALCAAVSRARFEVVHILLERGANVNSVGGPYGNALQAAAWVGNVAIVEALHRNGAKINARGEGNCTALQVASFAGNAGAVRSLLVRGAQVNAFGGKYGLAMEAANAGGHFEVIKLLLEHGASFETIQISPITTSLVREGIEPAAQTYIEPDKDCSFSPGSTLDLSLSLQRQISAPISPEKGATSNCPQPEISDLGFSTISNPSNAEIDIVFVHGLQGHPEKTWTFATPAPKKRSFLKSSTGLNNMSMHKPIFWPYELLSKEPALANARLITWGYNTHVVADFFGTSDQQNISQHGNNLMVALQQERKRDPYRPLLFVAHSLGGILVKVALDNSKRAQHQPQYLPIYDSTRGIIFLGTPHKGSTTATWGLLASNLAKVALQGPNDKILKGLKPNNELLENLRMVFLQMLEDNKFKIHSFYETQPMLGLYGLRDRVVPYESAQVGHARHEIVREINGNHSEICKFSKVTDSGYKAIFGALEDYIKAATTQGDN